jgi:hypothetical protein
VAREQSCERRRGQRTAREIFPLDGVSFVFVRACIRRAPEVCLHRREKQFRNCERALRAGGAAVGREEGDISVTTAMAATELDAPVADCANRDGSRALTTISRLINRRVNARSIAAAPE